MRQIPFRRPVLADAADVRAVLREVSVDPDLRTLWIETAMTDYLRTSGQIKRALSRATPDRPRNSTTSSSSAPVRPN